MSSTPIEFSDGRLDNAWRDLKVGEQEEPQGILALDEMSTRTARDEHQPVVVPSPKDVNTSRHRHTSRSCVARPVRLARQLQYGSAETPAHHRPCPLT